MQDRSLSLEFYPQVKVFTKKHALADRTPYLFPPREEPYKDPLRLLSHHAPMSVSIPSHGTAPSFPPPMGSVIPQQR